MWAALTEPEQIKQYMFGSHVDTDWQPGSPIVWKGEYEGRTYEDKGEVLEVEAKRRLKVTHFSPLGGRTIHPRTTTRSSMSSREPGETHVSLSQDNNQSGSSDHSRANWEQMLDGLKQVVEGS